jgi:hypothetical protein
MSGDAYIGEINSINSALKQYGKSCRELRKQRKLAVERLYSWMKSNRLDEFKTYKLDKIAPKPQVQRKKAKEKKEDAIRLFIETGIADPEGYWDAFQKTQKHVPVENE